ncbi:hypothetical protein REH76_24810, partial [Photobacterium damselae]
MAKIADDIRSIYESYDMYNIDYVEVVKHKRYEKVCDKWLILKTITKTLDKIINIRNLQKK